MAEIGQLSLRLPAGFESRAARLAQLTAQALAAHALPATGTLELLHLAPLQLDARRSDRALASTLARHIASGITSAAAEAPDQASTAVRSP